MLDLRFAFLYSAKAYDLGSCGWVPSPGQGICCLLLQASKCLRKIKRDHSTVTQIHNVLASSAFWRASCSAFSSALAFIMAWNK